MPSCMALILMIASIAPAPPNRCPVAGGSEAAVNEAGVGGFGALKALSTRNDSPQTASRPFDVNRDGFVMGEGAGSLILEEYEHAKRRGAKIYLMI